MKKNILFAIACLSLCFMSCEQDDHDHECHECHVALVECCGATEPHDAGEHEVEIGEFCGDDLANVEANGWIATQAIIHDGEEVFSVGDLVPASMVHCEEHADH